MRERLYTKLGVVAGDGFEWVMADACIAAPHEQHALGHDLVELHGVVTGATGQGVEQSLK